MAGTHEPRRFWPNDTITIEMDFQDESGVDEVYAHFVNVGDRKHTIGLRGSGDGGSRLKIIMEARTATKPAPGEYRCRYIHTRDVHDNYAVSHPDQDIVFWVEETGEARVSRDLAS